MIEVYGQKRFSTIGKSNLELRYKDKLLKVNFSCVEKGRDILRLPELRKLGLVSEEVNTVEEKDGGIKKLLGKWKCCGLFGKEGV